FLAVTRAPAGLQGTFSFTDKAPVAFAQIEALPSATADVAVIVGDGKPTAVPGTPVTYTVTVTNPGAFGMGGLTVGVPTALTGATWTAAFSAGGPGAASGSGPVNETVTLPAGGTVTYTFTGTIDQLATGTLSQSASGTAPDGFADPNPANNLAADTDQLT